MDLLMLQHRFLASFAVLACVALAPAGSQGADDLKRGEYLMLLMDCGGCHTPGALDGQPDMAQAYSGSDTGFQLPGLGTFYPPNLTADAETGLGSWSLEDIVTAVRTGVRPDGRELAPIMPWHSYAVLTDEDAQALASYIKSLPAISHQVPGPFGPDQAPSHPFLQRQEPR
jgi:mono/diheme cytochrome c family protein